MLLVIEWVSDQFDERYGGQLQTGLTWVTTVVPLAFMLGLGGSIALLQYKYRKTRLARGVAVGCAALIITVMSLLPLKWVIPTAAESSPIMIDPAGGARIVSVDAENPERGHFTSHITLAVREMPDKAVIRPDLLHVEVELPGTGVIKPKSVDLVSEDNGSARLNLVWTAAAYNRIAHSPVRMRVSLNYSLFTPVGDTVLPPNTPTAIPDVGRCVSEGWPQQRVITCRSPLRWSRYLVSTSFGRDRLFFPRPTYSPLPAELAIDPLVTQSVWQSGPEQAPWPSTIHVSTLRPSAYHQNFVIDGVRLDGR